ncbi:MAG: penicillin-binding protein 2 [Pseudomonadales bacterium]|nr:penicillin-binding protein 2 [Pseudomonadales bacterium]
MNWTELLNDEGIRLRMLLVGMLGAFLALAAFFWNVQVTRHREFQSSQVQQSMRGVRLPGPRGRIWDRSGVLLAGNRPSYAIALYVEELRQPGNASNTVNKVEAVLDTLSRRLGVPRALTREQIVMHIGKRRPLPLVAWRGIDTRVMARWAEMPDPMAGVDIVVEPVRDYPEPTLAAHVLGYVGRLDPGRGEDFDYYLPDMEGRSGMELTLNSRLAGEAGGRLLQVDASGFMHREHSVKAPRPGEDVVLTLDAAIQRLAEAALAGERGACVVLDPRNGNVLALASAPGYSIDALRDVALGAKLAVDPGRPYVNRAIAGAYPPGSTFKPLVAIAALENKRATAETVFDCPGYYDLGGLKIGCWRTSGHGPLAMRMAIEQSCNAYFCALGIQCGYPRMFHMAEAVGFGHATGIELAHEGSGLLPDAPWKERVHHDGWRSGDTANISIGQGYLLVTPLQMAVFAATIANGGYVYRPRLVAEHPEGDLVNDMRWSPDTLELVRGGMTDVVESPTGTGKRAKLTDVRVAGKTGSAEYGPREKRRKYAWMLTFAPAESPRYVAVMVLEDAISGGISTAPRIHDLLTGIFSLEHGLAAPVSPEGGRG